MIKKRRKNWPVSKVLAQASISLMFLTFLEETRILTGIHLVKEPNKLFMVKAQLISNTENLQLLELELIFQKKTTLIQNLRIKCIPTGVGRIATGVISREKILDQENINTMSHQPLDITINDLVTLLLKHL